ncbi:hypothetical protein CTI12_AA558880 [Artemisia annua]|uniref:Uncharacterized protein n=1 Tax=Artemisia annua TaxID=35608 RepID=A0A2U1KW86_ARTAN|nr:hypothetical protein CTI12_AA558880 [Artemisia annua]
MAATPNLNELKEATGSDNLADALKLLFIHDKSEEHDCLFETQMRDRRKLDLLAQLLVLAREGMDKKDDHLERM